jgi:hypothetical protein
MLSVLNLRLEDSITPSPFLSISCSLQYKNIFLDLKVLNNRMFISFLKKIFCNIKKAVIQNFKDFKDYENERNKLKNTYEER